MWNKDTSNGLESRKCRDRVISYLRGRGLDVGCGNEKVVATAIGVDKGGAGMGVFADLSRPNALAVFADSSMDYVFSSHCLEDFYDTEGILAEWWRVIKPGGYLVIYCPDKGYYPNIGVPGHNICHKHDFYWEDIWGIIEKYPNAEKVSASRHNEEDEYSWQLIVQKKFDTVPADQFIEPRRNTDACEFPVSCAGKKALVIRYGAIGDAIFMTPVVRQLKQDGYYVVVNTVPMEAEILRNNPNIDKFIIQERGAVPNKLIRIDEITPEKIAEDDQLSQHYAEISKGFDRVVNLNASIEGALLPLEGHPEFKESHEVRHAKFNKNYTDHTMEIAGYPDKKGCLPELFFTPAEEYLAQMFRKQYQHSFLMLVSLSGSSFHKTYPFIENVCRTVVNIHPDIRIVTVGDYGCRLLEWDGSNTISKSGEWEIRDSLMMTKYANLVFGCETGILNGASCYDTPKICLLSHSSRENLTKYWKNDYSLEPIGCDCHPCHQLHYTFGSCPQTKIGEYLDGAGVNQEVKTTSCMACYHPKRVIDRILEVYDKFWKPSKNRIVLPNQAGKICQPRLVPLKRQ